MSISVNHLIEGTDSSVPVGFDALADDVDCAAVTVVEVGVSPLPALPIRPRRLFMMLVIAVKRSGVPDYKIQSDNHSLVETPPPTLTVTASLHPDISQRLN